jgi:hypothetical protein
MMPLGDTYGCPVSLRRVYAQVTEFGSSIYSRHRFFHITDCMYIRKTSMQSVLIELGGMPCASLGLSRAVLPSERLKAQLPFLLADCSFLATPCVASLRRD